MAYAGAKKPGKIGKITSPFDAGDIIGIDGKTWQVHPDRVAMVQKMELKIGETVEYKQLSQGPDKNKINFISRPEGGEAPQSNIAEPAAAAAPATPRQEPQVVSGKYLRKSGTEIFLQTEAGEVGYHADLDVLQILSAANPKVKPGDAVNIQLVDVGVDTWIAHKIGPGTPAESFKSGKEILQGNIDAMKKEPSPAPLTQESKDEVEKMATIQKEAAEHQEKMKKENADRAKAKADADGDARIKENATEAERLAAERRASIERCNSCGHLIDNKDGTKTCNGNDKILDPNCKNHQEIVKAKDAETAVKDAPLSKAEDVWTSEFEEFKARLWGTKREGIDRLLTYLEKQTDFFIAPSSTKFHDNEAGGLLHHSLKVYHNLKALSQIYKGEYKEDSLIIIGLLHDVCKANFYKQSKKSLPRRRPDGELELDNYGKKIWDETLAYDVEDQFPIGHGEKSVILILRQMSLTDEEIMAIRWHMMAYDDLHNSYAGNLAITTASSKFPIIPLVHIADLSASFLEMRSEAVRTVIDSECREMVGKLQKLMKVG